MLQTLQQKFHRLNVKMEVIICDLLLLRKHGFILKNLLYFWTTDLWKLSSSNTEVLFSNVLQNKF